jgi:hypothetical protein
MAKQRIAIVAYGRTFSGNVVSGASYAAELSNAVAAIQPSEARPDTFTGFVDAAQQQLPEIAASESESSEYVHLSDVRVNNGVALRGIRIPLAAVQSYLLKVPNQADSGQST